MAYSKLKISKILDLQQEYLALKPGKEALLNLIDEAEVPESVYNSNAIENSTLSLNETEQILLEMEVRRKVSLREVYEAKNLARVLEYIKAKAGGRELDRDLVLFFHQILISGIEDDIAGRFRKAGEYVKVGNHIAPGPEQVERLVDQILFQYKSDIKSFLLEKIAKFHLDFENAHPFIDGNGRIGRILINFQLMANNLPPIIIRDKEKYDYYEGFKEYRDKKKVDIMEDVLHLSLMEALHKRITYLKGQEIIPVTEYAKQNQKSIPAMLNAARRQNIPAFREKGAWKIGKNT